MTRINVVEPSELTNKHLMGELHEITRVYGLVRKAQDRKINKYNFKDKIKQPSAYTLGAGHVYFFYNKLGFITERYYALNQEAVKRNFNVNPIEKEQLVSGIQSWWFGDYEPTQEALAINRKRITERLGE
jgi:deoxyribonuclease (pyrimidine dimer)